MPQCSYLKPTVGRLRGLSGSNIWRVADFRNGSKAEVALPERHVGSALRSGHRQPDQRCQLCAKSRHQLSAGLSRDVSSSQARNAF
jgi:hypothetical protein